MKIDTHALKSHPLLALIPRSMLRKILTPKSFVEYPKGTVMVREGDPCDAIYLIISGRCEVRHSSDDGVQKVITILGPGDVFGEHALLNLEPYRATISVVTHSVMLRMPAEALRKLFMSEPTFAGRFTQQAVEAFRKHRIESRVQRIVSLMAISPGLANGLLVQKLASALQKLTRQKVLVLHLHLAPQSLQLKDWPLEEVDGVFRYERDLQRNQDGFEELWFHVGGDVHEPAYIAPLISHCGRHFDYVLLHIGTDIPTATATECMIESDLAFGLIEAEAKHLYDYQLLIRDLCVRANGHCEHVKPILYLQKGADSKEFSETMRGSGHPPHSYVHGFANSEVWNENAPYAMHIRRLAREIARCRVGLALSSGSARGLAHIGVIQVLEENGIEVDVVAGSSMGAYVGSIWAAGFNGTEMEQLARELEGRYGLLKLISPVIPPRQGFLRADRVIKRLRKSLDHLHFSDMVRPLRIVATYLDTVERIVFSSGEVVRAVEASIAIPGILLPITIDGEVFIDGGIADPLPVDTLREMGIEHIIAVNTIPTPERLRHYLEIEREKESHQPKKKFTISGFLNHHLNYFAKGNLLDIMWQSIHGVQTRVAEAASERADIVLRPFAVEAHWHDFTHPQKYIAAGRKETEAHLAQIKQLIEPNPHEKQSPFIEQTSAAA